MSKSTVVYDAIVESMAAAFPKRTRIPNPYSLSDNDHRFMLSGYGIKVGPASVSQEDDEFCSRNIDQRISIVFTEENIRLDSDDAPMDDNTKILLEAVNTIQGIFFDYNNSIESVSKVDIDGTTAIESTLGVGNNKFLTIETSFLILLKERL